MEKKKFSGWLQMVILSFVVGLTAQIGVNAVSLSNAVMKTSGQVAMSATVFGLGTTIYSLMQSLPQGVVGAIVKKKGGKFIYMIAVPMMAIGCLIIPRFLSNDLSYLLVYGVFWGLCYMLVSQVAKQTIVSNWFQQKRGLAMNLLQGVSILFSFVCPYIIKAVLAKFGDFHYGWYTIGISALIAVPLVFLLKDKPEDVGEYPDGLEPGAVYEGKAKKSGISTVYKAPADAPTLSYKEAMKQPVFWLFVGACALGYAISGLGFGISNVHFLQNGYTLAQITAVTSIRALVQFAFLMLFARISDRIEPGFIFGIVGVLTAVAIAMVATGTSMVNLYFEMCISMVFANCVNTLLPTAVSNYFGRKSFPSIQGFLLMFAIVASTTSIICGVIADANGGSYTIAFYVYAVVCLVAAAMGFAYGIVMHKKYKAEAAQ